MCEFYSRSINSWLVKIDIELHSTHNEGKCIISGRLIRTLKHKNCKYVT